MDILKIYGYRFQIELGFRQAIHTLASYQYHLWMHDMDKSKRNSGNQYMHKKSKNYRRLVRRKLDAYHRYVQIGCIAQGLLIYLSIVRRKEVWRCCRSWYRTTNVNQAPTELIVQATLRQSASEFLFVYCPDKKLAKMIRKYRDRKIFRRMKRAA